MRKITLSLISAGLLMAGTPVHDKMDIRLKGKSFGGTNDDYTAAEDGLGILPLQHHTGTTDMNNELITQKVFDRVLKSETDRTKTADIRASLAAGTVGTIDDRAILSNVGTELSTPNLYEFTSHTFTSCGITGMYGPTLAQCKTAYSTSWDENSTNFNMTSQGIQEWIVPTDGTYRIEANGASAGTGNFSSSYVGHGAKIRGDVTLTKGEKLFILVGQKSNNNGSGNTGGGGGSFVAKGTSLSSSTPLIIAGGAGGAESVSSLHANSHASLTTTGNINQGGCSVNFTPGSNGNGGAGGDSGNWGGSGGGFYTNGLSTARFGGPYGNGGEGGFAFVNGGNGGRAYLNNAVGGFGGGGGAYGAGGGAGSGGGYSGGGSGDNNGNCAAGGGASYNIGTNQSNSVRTDLGDGFISITKL